MLRNGANHVALYRDAGHSPGPLIKALLDALWQTMSRAGGSTLRHCLAWQLEGPGRVFVNQLIAWPGMMGIIPWDHGEDDGRFFAMDFTEVWMGSLLGWKLTS